MHTVGPQGEFADELQSCYQTCIQKMNENSLKSIVRFSVDIVCMNLKLISAVRTLLIVQDTVYLWSASSPRTLLYTTQLSGGPFMRVHTQNFHRVLLDKPTFKNLTSNFCPIFTARQHS